MRVHHHPTSSTDFPLADIPFARYYEKEDYECTSIEVTDSLRKETLALNGPSLLLFYCSENLSNQWFRSGYEYLSKPTDFEVYSRYHSGQHGDLLGK